MKYVNINIKWHHLQYLIIILIILSTTVHSLSTIHNFETDEETKKIVKRYNIDINKHRVIGIDYLELHQKNNTNNENEVVTRKARANIKKLNYYEKNDSYNRKFNNKPAYNIEYELITNPEIINLTNESKNKKSVNDFIFHIFCIDGKMDECEKYRDNLNSIGESLTSQLAVKEPINIFVKVISFCNAMGKSCGAVKTYATSTPTSFYVLKEELDNMSYLYPQALVKQLNLNGNVEFLKYDISLAINSDINYWFWSDEKDINESQIDFQHVVAKEIVHSLGFLSGLNQSFKMDYSSIFSIITKHKDHPYLLPYFHYGSNGYFNAPIIKNILPLFIFDKYLSIQNSNSEYTPIWNYFTPFYEFEKIKNNYVSLSIKRIEEDYDVFEGINYLYNYAEESTWVFNSDYETLFQESNNYINNKNKPIPIDTNIFNEWVNGLSGSHTQCDSFYHTARNKNDGIMCSFIDEGVKLFERNSKLLTDRELIVLSTIGWNLINDIDNSIAMDELQFNEENNHKDAIENNIEEIIEDEMNEALNNDEKTSDSSLITDYDTKKSGRAKTRRDKKIQILLIII